MRRNTLKTILFITITILLYAHWQRVFIPKWYDNGWNHAKIVKGFYSEKENTIDVLCLGASQFMSGIIPLEMYIDEGISAYSLSTSEQEIASSYFLLLEACKYQEPKVVLFEPQMLFMDTNELRYHQTIDYMRLSITKIELILELYKNGRIDEPLLYLFPLFNYHSRWKELTKEDFSENFYATEKGYYTKGYAPFTNYGNYNYDGLKIDNDEKAEISDFKMMFLNKIISYCKDKGIEVVIVKTPRMTWTKEQHNKVNEIALNNELPFLDYNVNEIYNESGFDSQHDFLDEVHLNYYGARKLTKSVTRYLKNTYQLVDHREDKEYSGWEEDIIRFESTMNGLELKNIYDIEEYFRVANSVNNTIFISIQGITTDDLTKEGFETLHKMGITNIKDQEYRGFYAIIEGDKVLKVNMGFEVVSSSGLFDEREHYYYIESAGGRYGKESVVCIDDVEYTMQGDGMIIVVFDNDNNEVIDSLCLTNGKIERT